MYARSLVVVSLLCSTLLAQIGTTPRDSYGVGVVEGEVRAGGPDYAARFTAEGVSYLALSHRRGVDAASLHFRFTAVARGGCDRLVRAANAVPTVAGQEVHYEHGGVREVYAAQVDGIEQSFVIAQRPDGEGDLVVRGEITTELPVTAASAGGLCFERDGHGVTFGSVTGVDANGVRMPGSLQLRGTCLELTLPSAFVEHAAYPLTVDPLIGSAFPVGNVPGVDDDVPAIAYDGTSGRYLVVWSVDIAGTQSEIRGQLLASGGGLVGSQIVLANSFLGRAPSVASVNATNRFLVTCIDQNTYTTPVITYVQPFVKCFSVAAATGAVSNAVVIAGGGVQDPAVTSARVGGDSRIGIFGANEHALVVYSDTAGLFTPTESVHTALVHVPASGDPVVQPGNTLASVAAALDAYVSTSCGANGHWLVGIASHLNGPANLLYQRYTAQLLDAAGNACGGSITLYNGGPNADLRNLSIATRDGNEFVATWEDLVTSSIQLRRIVWSGPCASGSWAADPLRSPVVQTGLAHAPSIAFAKDKYLLSWSQQVGFNTAKVYVKGLDPVTCGNCGAELRVDTGTATEVTPAIASQWSGGDGTSDAAMVVWSNPAIRGRVVEAVGAGGTVTALGGGCGISGLNDFATYTGLPTLGTTFTIDLLNPTSPVLGLAVGFSQVGIACGACTLVGSMDILLPVASSAPVAVPCDANLIGFQLWSQWVQLRASGCPILPTIGLSNCLKFTIGE